MTKLHLDVYNLIQKIPKGKVVTYGTIAKTLKLKSARMVGQILHQNIDRESIPCHRVVFKDGNLASGYAFGGTQAQKNILLAEGVLFIKDKVDMSVCRCELK